MRILSTVTVILGLMILSGPTFAEDDISAAITARKSHMQLYQFNLGVLGDMARSKTEYDPEIAAVAAQNLFRLTQTNTSAYWPDDSDSESLPGQTRALPLVWNDFSELVSINARIRVAAEALVGKVGDGLPALQAGVRDIGQSCAACHRGFRVPEN